MFLSDFHFVCIVIYCRYQVFSLSQHKSLSVLYTYYVHTLQIMYSIMCITHCNVSHTRLVLSDYLKEQHEPFDTTVANIYKFCVRLRLLPIVSSCSLHLPCESQLVLLDLRISLIFPSFLTDIALTSKVCFPLLL